MTKEEFEKLSEDLKTDILKEIAYEYAVFVPKDEPRAISKFKSIVCLSDKKFLAESMLANAGSDPIFPYNVIMEKIEKMVDEYYREFKLGTNAQELLTKYGSRGEKFNTYFIECLKTSQNTTEDAVKDELFRQLCRGNDVKSALKAVADVVGRRTASAGRLLESLAGQMEQLTVLWNYEDKGYTKYRINTIGENCDECQSISGNTLQIADIIIGENYTPLHPNCDCTVEILDEFENVVYTIGKSEQDEHNVQHWGKYLKSSFKQLALGNYTDDANLLGTTLQVLAGLFGVDLSLDIRDLVYDLTNFKPTGKHILQTILDTVALVPVVGSIKYADEVGDAIKAGAKYSDEIVDTAKAADKVTDFADFPKTIHHGRQGKHIVGHNNYREGRSILTITPDYAEELIEKYSGTGQKINNTSERINFKSIIGKFVDEETGKAYDTTI